MKKLRVLSLFDGISCGRIALDRAGIKIDVYYASEIKEHAIRCSKANYNDIIHLGDINKIDFSKLGHIDLLIGGSPCKGISMLNRNQEGLEHPESKLFYKYFDALEFLRKVNPKIKFILENTKGHKDAIATISHLLGVKPININSALVSAQNRPRKYWTNISKVSLPIDKNITIDDILIKDFDAKYLVPTNRLKWLLSESGQKSVRLGFSKINPYPKAGCLTALGHKKWNCNYIVQNGKFRYLYREELEALQTMPKGYCNSLSYDEMYDVLGDGWTIDVVSHILKHLLYPSEEDFKDSLFG